MIVYINHPNKLFSIALPKVVDGNYVLRDEDSSGNDRMLVNVVAKDGKWTIAGNKKISILNGESPVNDVVLEEYKEYSLKLNDTGEIIEIYTSPVMDSSFTCFNIDKTKIISIGRTKENNIIYNNPLIGERHAAIAFDKFWKIKDLGNKFGTYVNGERITGERYLLNGDIVFILGLKAVIVNDKIWVNNPNKLVTLTASVFSVSEIKDNNIKEEYVERENIKLYETKDYFSRVSSFSEVVSPAHFILDDYPKLNKPEEMPLLLTVGPMLTMSMTSVSTLMISIMNYQNNQNPTAIVGTAVMSFAMLAGTLLWPSLTRSYQKKKYQKDKNEIESKYTAYLNKKDSELSYISTSQKQILLSNNVSSMEAYNMAMSKSQGLWRREIHQNDFLNVRLGMGKVPLQIDYKFPEEHFAMDEDVLYQKVSYILEKHKLIEDAPIIESLTENNIISIIGKHGLVKSFTDKLLLQILFLQSYYDLKIVLFTDKKYEKEWEYLKKCPHIFESNKDIRYFATNEEDSKEIAQYLLNIFSSREPADNRENKEEYKNFDTYYLIITDNYDVIKEYPLFEKIFKSPNNLGFSVMILNNNFANLPVECHKFIGINSETEGGLIDSSLSTDKQKIFKIEEVTNVNYNAFCTSIANIPIVSKKGTYKLPRVYNFLEMYEAGNVSQLNSLERWRYNDPVVSLSVPIGVNSSGGLFKLDLHEKYHGPHGLIAGMTGSGKSDFIISYILSLAINFHPEEVQFLLIDYKGGGLVGAFENKESGIRLPHLAGTITNLDKAEINRAMSAIQTELERRQALFRTAKEKLNEGTIDIYKYQKYYRDGLLDTPLSHLYIISDEFAELKSQEPEFMDSLISTARIGRSLGVHLILATQKPSGVVNDQIWSNARFKICLKVQDSSDSNEVIKRPDAAYLKDPGRFYLQVGYNELFDIGQAAYSETSYIPKEQVHKEIDDNINFINNIGEDYKTINFQKNENEKVEGEQLTNIVKYLYDLANKEQIKTKPLWLEQLPKILYIDDILKKYRYEKKVNNIEAVVGLYDNPKMQTQNLLTVNFTKNGNSAIYSMEDRTTIIETMIYSLISNYSAEELNLYILDFDSQTLKPFKQAPQVGDVLFINETDKLGYLLRNIYNEVETRKELFQNYNGSFEFYLNNSGKKLPGIVFIIHGFENFKENFETEAMDIDKLAREGARYGVYLVLTAANYSAVRMNLKNSLPQSLPLKLQAQSDYTMILNKKAPIISDIDNRGAVLIGDEIYEFQTAIIADEEKKNSVIEAKITELNKATEARANEIKTLPETVTFNDVIKEPLKINRLPIGIESETLDISYLDITKSFITCISASGDEPLTNFAVVLYRELKSFNNLETLVYDCNNYFVGGTAITKNTIEDLNKILDPNRRNLLVVLITGVSKWVELLDEETKNSLKDWFANIAKLKNCLFIFIDKQQDLKTLYYEDWFKAYVPNDRGVYLGKGIANYTYISVSNSYKELNEILPDNFGFNIEDGYGVKIKVVEEDING